MSTTNTHPSIFNFFNHKLFFRPIWSIAFRKIVFIFWYSNTITNFKFWVFIISFFIRISLCVWFYINRFHFNCAIICIIILLTILSNLSIVAASENDSSDQNGKISTPPHLTLLTWIIFTTTQNLHLAIST